MATSNRIWHDLRIIAKELRCDVTLQNGQSFAWKSIVANREWVGVIGNTVYGLKQCEQTTKYCVYARHNNSESKKRQKIDDDDHDTSVLREYFHMDTIPSLSKLYDSWCTHDDTNYFKSIANKLLGVRLIRQEPIECLLSFICSANNHITRITHMIDSLRKSYGTYICTVENHEFYTFPTLEDLANITEQELRTMGFGYRARYVYNTVAERNNTDIFPLSRFRQQKHTRQEVLTTLMQLYGVGPKLADCIALYSLDQYDCVPIDTHIWQLALQKYRFLPAQSKKTTKNLSIVADKFRDVFKTHAGWAQSVLFTSCLKEYKDKLL